MRLKIRIQSQETEDYLRQLQPRIFRAVQLGLIDLINRIVNRVRRKLSGEVLHVGKSRPGYIGGTLRQSIHSTVQKMPWGFLGTIGTNVRYAGIHEYGGTIYVPDIYPVKKKALHFFIGGQEIFAKKVKAHAIRMPERSYLRSSLREMEPFADKIILDYIEDALSG